MFSKLEIISVCLFVFEFSLFKFFLNFISKFLNNDLYVLLILLLKLLKVS